MSSLLQFIVFAKTYLSRVPVRQLVTALAPGFFRADCHRFNALPTPTFFCTIYPGMYCMSSL